MNRLIFVILFLFTSLLFAQNDDKHSSRNWSGQEVDNKVMESTIEALRTVLVPGFVMDSVDISDTESLGDSIDLGDTRLIGIDVPSTKTTGSLTFQTFSYIEGGWIDIKEKNGTELVYVPSDSLTATRLLCLRDDFAGIRYLKIRNGTSAVPVPIAGGDVTLGLITQRY